MIARRLYLRHDCGHGKVNEADKNRAQKVDASDSQLISDLFADGLPIGHRKQPLTEDQIQIVYPRSRSA